MELISKQEAKAQGLKRYFTGKPCKNGHVSERFTSNGHCVQCQAEYAERNYEAHREYARKYNAKWRKQNPERFTANQKRSREKPENRAQRVIDNVRRARVLMKTSPEFKAVTRIRTLLLNTLKRHLAGKTTSTEKLLGCSAAQFVAHIEAQFLPGMSWANHGDWHFDHIRPIASFENPEDSACWHFTNFQPLWAADNIRKSDTWEPNEATA